MSFQLAVTPAGRVTAVETDTDDKLLNVPASETRSDLRFETRIARLLAACQAEGLFTLAAGRGDRLNPSFEYWRDLASRYLTQLCHIPQMSGASIEEMAPPTAEEMSAMLLNVPPMQGAEYLTEAVLSDIWKDLDAWVRSEAAGHRDGLSGFLKERAPLWHQVGRVCFHLAENRRDPDYPFAFSGDLRSRPDGRCPRAVPAAEQGAARVRRRKKQESAGQAALARPAGLGEKRSLPRNWSNRATSTSRWPGRRARPTGFSRKSRCSKRAASWCACPTGGRSGPGPAWASRSATRNGRSSTPDAMLDFQVTLALGDQELTRSRMARTDGGRRGAGAAQGQWVEVDREKLAEALDHWKTARAAGTRRTLVRRRHAAAGRRAHGPARDERDQDQQARVVVRPCRQMARPSARATCAARKAWTARASRIAALKATLRKYQETGVGWLWFLSSLGLGACLADDMGLGQDDPGVGPAGGAEEESDARKPSLLVVPASLLANWKSEMERFTPTLRALFVHPSETTKDELAAWPRHPDSGAGRTRTWC